MIEKYDTIVIGSGPAGCAAAISCVQQGLTVLIVTDQLNNVDSGMLPLQTVHPGVSSLLEKLRAPGIIEIASAGDYAGVQTGNHIVSLGEDEAGPWIGHHINRILFDESLMKHAIDQGVEILEENKVIELIESNGRLWGVKTNRDRIFHSEYIIDASGYKRTAGKKLQLAEQFFSAPLVAWTGTASGIMKHHDLYKNAYARFIPCKTGWTWLAQQPPDRCTWTRLSLKTKQEFSPPVELESYLQIGPINVYNMRWRIFRPLCKEGLILCGDAAGILDPASGQGILQALYSGIVAAQTVSSIFEKPQQENFYLTLYDQWFLDQYIYKARGLREYYKDHGIEIFSKVNTWLESFTTNAAAS